MAASTASESIFGDEDLGLEPEVVKPGPIAALTETVREN